MSGRLEIPLPPRTLPLFHDAICTAICITIAEAGHEAVKGLRVEQDPSRALSKVIVEGDVDLFKAELDRLFGTEKLRPSSSITINRWRYFSDVDLTALEMGDSRFPGGLSIGKDVARLIRKQCYLFAKGFKYVASREEARGLRPKRGYFKLGIDTPLLSLIRRVMMASHETLKAMGASYTLLLLVSEPPRSVDEAIASRSLYRVEREGGRVRIALNNEVTRHIVPRGASNLILEAPDLIYHNLTLALVRRHIEGTLDVNKLPSINIYVYPGTVFDDSKDLVVQLTCTSSYLQGLLSTLTSIHGVDRASHLIGRVNRAVHYLGELIGEAQVREELRAISSIIPHVRSLLNNLVAGAPFTDELYMAIRLLEALRKVDERVDLLLRELTGILA